MSEELNRELLRKYQEHLEGQDSLNRKLDLVRTIRERVREVYPRSNAMIFGSSMSGMSLKGSDLDIVILMGQYGTLSKDEKNKILRTLKDKWSDGEQRGLYREKLINHRTELISAAAIPLLKIVCPGDIEADISICSIDKVHEGLRSTHLLMCYNKIDKCVSQLVVLVKHWAKQNRILGPSEHRLGGYGLTLMIIFFLQSVGVIPVLQAEQGHLFDPSSSVVQGQDYSFSRQDNVLTNYQRSSRPYKGKWNDDRLADLFLDFFKFFSNFKFNSFVISVRMGKLLNREDCLNYSGRLVANDDRQWRSVMDFLVEEPFLRSNVARVVNLRSTADEIKLAFAQAWKHLEKDSSQSINIYF